MTLSERRTGRIDRDLAVQPFWQLGPQPLRTRVQRRDLFGTIAKADGAPLAEPELDALSWIIDEWHQQGSPSEGRVRFTWYALARDLYGSARPGWSPSGRHRELLRDAIDHLHQVVVTLRSINVHDGDTERTLRSKVHILETVVDHDDVTRYRDDAELARIDDESAGPDVDAGRVHAAALGRLRRDSVEVSIAPWLVHQLLTGAVVLDWRTQRKLAGAAKRLWYQLCALAREFEPTGLPGEARITIMLDSDFYAAMHLSATRERDNRAALAAAAQRLVAADDTFRSARIARRDDGTYELRAVRVMPPTLHGDDAQLLLTTGDA